MSLLRLLLVTVCALSVTSSPLRAQSLADAAAKGAAAKPLAAKKITNADLPKTSVPEGAVTAPAPPRPTSPTVAATPAPTRNAAADALLGRDLTALRTVLRDHNKLAAQYAEACAGKVTSAGWTLRGEEITTANWQTPACRTIAADLERQSVAYAGGRRALEEKARTSGILPGVMRALFTSYGFPD